MKYLLLFLFWVITIFSLGQTKPADLKPILAAIQVRNLDSSISFYTNHLGFALKEKKEFPDYNLKLAIVENNGFEFELVENEKSISKTQVLKENNAQEITGIAKLAFSVSNIEPLYESLNLKEVKVILSLRKSNRDGKLVFIITDNENNWLEFTEQ